MRAFVDVRRLYGAWARGSYGAQIAGTVDRLGLVRLTGIRVRGRIADSQTIGLDLHVEIPGARTGLLAALGDPAPRFTYDAVPPDLLAISRFSVRPGVLYDTCMLLLAYHSPLQYGMAVAQLGEMERQLGKRLSTEILGKASEDAWLLRFRDKTKQHDVIEVGVADAPAIRALIEGLGQALSQVVPGMHVRQQRVGTFAVFSFSGEATFHLAVGAKTLATSDSLNGLRRYIGSRAELLPKQRSKDVVLASGFSTSKGLAAAVDGLSGPAADAVREGSWVVQEFRWDLRSGINGYDVDAVILAR